MKISINELRKIVQETITGLSEATDRDLAIGDIVSIIVHNRPMKGKIVDSYAAKFADPMAKGTGMMPMKPGHSMWAVEVGTKVFQVPADEIEIVRSKRNAVMGNSKKPAWKTDMNTKKTQEGVATLGMSTMLKGNAEDDPDEPRGHKTDPLHDRTEDLITDEELKEVDEKKEEEHYMERRYDTMARQLVNNFEDRGPKVNWKGVAKSYAATLQKRTGKTVDAQALQMAILRYIETDGDERNQQILGGTHYQYK